MSELFLNSLLSVAGLKNALVRVCHIILNTVSSPRKSLFDVTCNNKEEPISQYVVFGAWGPATVNEDRSMKKWS